MKSDNQIKWKMKSTSTRQTSFFQTACRTQKIWIVCVVWWRLSCCRIVPSCVCEHNVHLLIEWKEQTQDNQTKQWTYIFVLLYRLSTSLDREWIELHQLPDVCADNTSLPKEYSKFVVQVQLILDYEVWISKYLSWGLFSMHRNEEMLIWLVWVVL